MSCLSNFHQTSFPFFETTWQILCDQIGVVPRKNDIFYFMYFPKKCVHVARFDTPAAITLHVYIPAYRTNMNVYTEASATQETLLVRLGLREDFLRTFSCPLLHSTLNDHFVFVVLICYWFCAGC